MIKSVYGQKNTRWATRNPELDKLVAKLEERGFGVAKVKGVIVELMTPNHRRTRQVQIGAFGLVYFSRTGGFWSHSADFEVVVSRLQEWA